MATERKKRQRKSKTNPDFYEGEELETLDYRAKCTDYDDDDVPITKAKKAKMEKSSKTSKTKGEWTCSVCTLTNDANVDICGACENSKTQIKKTTKVAKIKPAKGKSVAASKGKSIAAASKSKIKTKKNQMLFIDFTGFAKDPTRTRPWVDKMSTYLTGRFNRARLQKMFMIEQNQISSTEREYKVLGSKANVYTVSISHQHTCSCPDSMGSSVCKHVLLILHKVLKISGENPLIWQDRLTSKELEKIFSEAPQPPANVIADEGVRRALAAIEGRDYGGDRSTEVLDDINDEVDKTSGVERKSTDGVDCPICFDELGDDFSVLVWCRAQCGNCVHTECFNKWMEVKTAADTTCPYCRVAWKHDAKGKEAVAACSSSIGHFGQYVNLASVSSSHSHMSDAQINAYDSSFWQRRNNYQYW